MGLTIILKLKIIIKINIEDIKPTINAQVTNEKASILLKEFQKVESYIVMKLLYHPKFKIQLNNDYVIITPIDYARLNSLIEKAWKIPMSKI